MYDSSRALTTRRNVMRFPLSVSTPYAQCASRTARLHCNATAGARIRLGRTSANTTGTNTGHCSSGLAPSVGVLITVRVRVWLSGRYLTRFNLGSSSSCQNTNAIIANCRICLPRVGHPQRPDGGNARYGLHRRAIVIASVGRTLGSIYM